MHDDPPDDPAPEHALLRLTPLATTGAVSFDLSHPYLEIVYGPLIGPSAVVLARSLGRRLAANPDGVDVCGVELALEVGLRAHSTEPLGGKCRLRKAFDRLEHARIIQWLGEHHVGVRTLVPPLDERQVAGLPAAARQTHDHFTVIDLRDRPQSPAPGERLHTSP